MIVRPASERRPAGARAALACVRARGAAAGVTSSSTTIRSGREIAEIVASGLGFVGEHDGEAVGLRPRADDRDERSAVLTDLYVAPEHRRRGAAAALYRGSRRGVTGARRRARRSGGDGGERRRARRLPALGLPGGCRSRWSRRPPSWSSGCSRVGTSVSFASIHVQTDDRPAVERAVAQFAPRVGSKGSRVEGPRNGWTAVYDEAADRDPSVLLRYARELSERMGIIVVAFSLELDQVVRMIALDRGGIVDEYLSVPEFYGSLPPGDVIGLAANPTVLARLTGADPAAVRAAAPTASSPAQLPPARELLAALAAVLGIEGAERGYAET